MKRKTFSKDTRPPDSFPQRVSILSVEERGGTGVWMERKTFSKDTRPQDSFPQRYPFFRWRARRDWEYGWRERRLVKILDHKTQPRQWFHGVLREFHHLHHICRTSTSSDRLAAVQTQTREGDRNAEEEQGGSGVSTATDKGQG